MTALLRFTLMQALTRLLDATPGARQYLRLRELGGSVLRSACLAAWCCNPFTKAK